MILLKCKMCGGNIEISSDKTYGTCDSCGCTSTFPKIDDEQQAGLFNRGNDLRMRGEFDKAAAVFERIVEQDTVNAEAHWCLALCRYGIEYVEDPKSGKRIPTCHRMSYDPFLNDVDYIAAVEHSDEYTAGLYTAEAKRIADIQKAILAISKREEPFDIFICYKETTGGGSRTKDSTIAQDIYYELINAGYKVFFSRITLEEKLGVEYEPYIFAALNSAKVMLVMGTSPEHFNAVWVKNEWSRFLSIIKNDRDRILVPCYRDMDPYDLPDELAMLQSQDMGKIGFLQDLIRGVKKVCSPEGSASAPSLISPVTAARDDATDALQERAYLCLSDGDFEKASMLLENVLNQQPRSARAYLGKLMAERSICQETALRSCAKPLSDSPNYRHALEFGDTSLRQKLEGYNAVIIERNRQFQERGEQLVQKKQMAQKKREEDARLLQEKRIAISSFTEPAQEILKKTKSIDEQMVINLNARKVVVVGIGLIIVLFLILGWGLPIFFVAVLAVYCVYSFIHVGNLKKNYNDLMNELDIIQNGQERKALEKSILEQERIAEEDATLIEKIEEEFHSIRADFVGKCE